MTYGNEEVARMVRDEILSGDEDGNDEIRQAAQAEEDAEAIADEIVLRTQEARGYVEDPDRAATIAERARAARLRGLG